MSNDPICYRIEQAGYFPQALIRDPLTLWTNSPRQSFRCAGGDGFAGTLLNDRLGSRQRFLVSSSGFVVT